MLLYMAFRVQTVYHLLLEYFADRIEVAPNMLPLWNADAVKEMVEEWEKLHGGTFEIPIDEQHAVGSDVKAIIDALRTESTAKALEAARIVEDGRRRELETITQYTALPKAA